MASLARIVKVANQLLNSIAVREREQILAECTTIPLPLGCVLYEANHAMRYAYFPTSGFVSLISQDGTKQGLEVSLVGAEGMVGSTLALGVRSSPLKALIQGEGSALRMRADRFAAALNESVQLRRVIGAYLFVQYAQVAQTATCGTFHGLDARLARWTLLTQDRAGVSRFRLTHELVAQMLGVRRAGVMAAQMLQKRRLIAYRRGMIEVLNRPGLEALACPCYKHQNDLYAMHVAATGKRG